MTRLIFSFLFFGLTLVANAQLNGSIVDLLEESDLLGDEVILDGSLVSINQVGSNNQAEVVQQQRFIQDNQVRILQQGNDNTASVLQTGGNNRVVLQQNGDENLYSLDLEGSSNDIAVIQNGDRNVVNQRLLDSRRVSVEFIQNGDGNLIEHNGDGLLSKDIRVMQSGDNMQVIINQTSVGFPTGN